MDLRAASESAQQRPRAPPVLGVNVDKQTRCAHWHSPIDVIALKFACCNSYYPCYSCHAEVADHPAIRWPKSRFDESAVLCGVCKSELTANEYLGCSYRCPKCGTDFNPGCGLHAHIYFEVDPKPEACSRA